MNKKQLSSAAAPSSTRLPRAFVGARQVDRVLPSDTAAPKPEMGSAISLNLKVSGKPRVTPFAQHRRGISTNMRRPPRLEGVPRVQNIKPFGALDSPLVGRALPVVLAAALQETFG